MDVHFEENPKWRALCEILDEVREEISSSAETPPIISEKILILTRDERTANQLQDVITVGARTLMCRMFNKSLGDKFGFIPAKVAEKIAAPALAGRGWLGHFGRGKNRRHRNSVA